jgi:hypothetical protein
MLDEQIFNPQNNNDNELVLRFLYNKYMNIIRPIIEIDVAEYGKSLEFIKKDGIFVPYFSTLIDDNIDCLRFTFFVAYGSQS